MSADVSSSNENFQFDKATDFDDGEIEAPKPKRRQIEQSRSCPYLDTINRSLLDFDFEKLCSISLTHLNVYACLVCGKYFQGRGKNTHAYTHSVDSGHRVYLNLSTLKFYCLPDNYEIIDSSLEDIIYVLRPTYTEEHIRSLDENVKLSRAYDSTTYYPGIVGLNNIKANDYCNVVLHALSHVGPIRNYFLREENYVELKRPPGDKMVLLTQRFGELMRKLWNPRNFKAHVSPHEMLQAVVLCSNKQFQITEQGQAIDFLSWLINGLHVALNGGKSTKSSIVYKTIRGQMRIFSRKIPPIDADEKERASLLLTEEYQGKSEDSYFLYLTLDLPPAPLYRDEFLQNIIPQVPLSQLLAKFNGQAEKEYKTYRENIMKKFELLSLPHYLIVYIKIHEKQLVYRKESDNRELPHKVSAVKACQSSSGPINCYIEGHAITVCHKWLYVSRNVDFYEYLSPDVRSEHDYTMYDLIANIIHDGQPDAGKGSYRIQIQHKGTGKWFELEDLHVKEILPQTITLTETYVQVWELNTTKKRDIDENKTDLQPTIDS